MILAEIRREDDKSHSYIPRKLSRTKETMYRLPSNHCTPGSAWRAQKTILGKPARLNRSYRPRRTRTPQRPDHGKTWPIARSTVLSRDYHERLSLIFFLATGSKVCEESLLIDCEAKASLGLGLGHPFLLYRLSTEYRYHTRSTWLGRTIPVLN